MSVTILTLAKVANDVYDNDAKRHEKGSMLARTGWHTDPKTDFTGAIYSFPNFNVVAFAGTDSLRDVFVSDLQLATGGMPEQAKNARELLFKSYNMGKPVMMVGHSLGGALCQILGNEDVPFVSFNAPPMATNLVSAPKTTMARKMVTAAANAVSGGMLGMVAYMAASKIRQLAVGNIDSKPGINIRLPYDPVSSSSWGGGHIGTVLEIPAEPWTVNRHGMGNVIASLEGKAKGVGDFVLT